MMTAERTYRAILLAVAMASLVLTHLAVLARSFDADSAGFALLVRDLLSGTSLSDWHMGTHLYLFPDAISTAIALGARAIGIDLYGAIIALSAICYVATLAAVLRIPLLWAALALNIAFLLSFALIGGWFELEMMSHLFVPSTHQGSILMGCLALAFIHRPAIVFTLVALTTMSDVVFVAWAALPLAIAARNLSMVATIGAATVLGALTSMVVGAQHNVRMEYVAGSQVPLARSIASATQFLLDGASFLTPSQGVIFYANVALWAAGVYCLLARRPIAYRTHIIFFSAASAGSLAAATLMGLFRGIETARYIMPYIVYVQLMAGFGVILLFRRWSVAVPTATAVSAAAAFALYFYTPAPRFEMLAKCLGDRHLTTGAAHYWDANTLYLADPRLRILPLEPATSQSYAWNTHRERLGITGVEFVVSTERLLDKDSAAFGKPARITPCADRLILEMR